MFTNLFTTSPSVWYGLIGGLISLPILIHLINLVRHRTIEWAAMEFLLKSHRKNRNWVWLKQFFLLLSRILILLLALFMLSQIGCENDRLSALIGGNSTHHYVLVDDSFSMSDRDSEGSAMDRARATILQVLGRAQNRSNHRFSVLRFSSFDVSDDQTMARFDIDNELVDSAFATKLETATNGLTHSAFAVSSEMAIDAVNRLVRSRDQENAIVYVLSDFRAKDWGEDNEAKDAMQEIADSGAAIELIRCVKQRHSNLVITELMPKSNVRVAETPLMMEVAVSNPSSEVANKVQVKIIATAYEEARDGAGSSIASSEELPTVFIESIEPGATETRQFPVFFQQVGQHSVAAVLEEDAVDVDNLRFSTVNIEENADVLMIDGADRLHSTFLSLAMNPNQSTGIRTVFQTIDFLRDASLETLKEFDVVFLCDLGPMDEVAVRNLEVFTEQGGGVVFFVGPNTNINFSNLTFYKNGKGLMPVELSKVFDVDERIPGDPADIVPEPHPIFAPVLGVGNSLLDLVQVKQVVIPTFEWLNAPPAQSRIIAAVRGDRQKPLVVEGQYGKGRTMAFLSTAGPMWNNWMRNPTFPPILLLLEDYMAEGQNQAVEHLVGQPIEIVKAAGSVTPDVSSTSPSRIPQSSSLSSIERLEGKIKLVPDGGTLGGSVGAIGASVNQETKYPGNYEFWFRGLDSSTIVERKSVNIDTAESDLALMSTEKLKANMAGLKPAIVAWDQFNPEPQQTATSSLNRVLLLLLFVFLIVEQTLAWSCSYHT